MAAVCAVRNALEEGRSLVQRSAEDSGRYIALMCGSEALALRHVAFYLNACQNIKSLSLGNAATGRSSIRNIHGITLGNLTAGTRCRHQQRRLIWAIRTWSIPRKRSW